MAIEKVRKNIAGCLSSEYNTKRSKNIYLQFISKDLAESVSFFQWDKGRASIMYIKHHMYLNDKVQDSTRKCSFPF